MGRANGKNRGKVSQREVTSVQTQVSNWADEDPEMAHLTPEQRALASLAPSREVWEAYYGISSSKSHEAELGFSDSEFIPSITAASIADMQRQHLFYHQAVSLISDADLRGEIVPEQLSLQDSFVRTLWSQEWTEVTDALRAMGADEILEVLENNKDELADFWVATFAQRIAADLESKSFETTIPSFYDLLLSGKIDQSLPSTDDTALALLRKLTLVQMANWSLEDGEAFTQFVHRTILPAAMRGYPFGTRTIDDTENAVADTGRRAIEALFGKEYLFKLESDLDILEQGGFFEGGQDRKDAYRSALMILSRAYLGKSSDPSKPDSWINPQLFSPGRGGNVHDKMIHQIVETNIKHIAMSVSRRSLFIQSELGQKVTDYINQSDSLRSLRSIKTETDIIAEAAGHFSDEIYKEIISGRLSLFEAWIKVLGRLT